MALGNFTGIGGQHDSSGEVGEDTSGAPSLDDPFSNPSYWGLGEQNQPTFVQQHQRQEQFQPQQDSPQPQIAAGRVAQGNPLSLPKDDATLRAMINQGVYSVIGNLAQTSTLKQQKINQLREQFMKSPQHRPWYPAAEEHFNQRVNEGYTIENAAAEALKHIKALHSKGYRPPENSKSLIPNQFSGGHQIGDGQFRGDEDRNQVGYYSDEDRLAARDRYIKDRNRHQEWIKTRGTRGKTLQESYPAAFE